MISKQFACWSALVWSVVIYQNVHGLTISLPLPVTATVQSSGAVSIQWQSAENIGVPYYKLDGYRVIVYTLEGSRGDLQQARVSPSPSPSSTFSNLLPKARYGVFIFTIYTRTEWPEFPPPPGRGQTISSMYFWRNETVGRVWHDNGTNFGVPPNSSLNTAWQRQCDCDMFGSSNASSCSWKRGDPSSCSCHAHYLGPACDKCSPGWYRRAPGVGPCLPCTTCQISMVVANDACNYDPSTGRYACSECLYNATGALCDDCPTGFHLSLGRCVPCECNGSPRLCNVKTSECTDCHNNTRGVHCQFCRDARLDKLKIFPPFCNHPVPSASNGFIVVLAVTVIGVFLMACLLVWCVLARRRQQRKRREQALWAVRYAEDEAEEEYHYPYGKAPVDANKETIDAGGRLQLRESDVMDGEEKVYQSNVYT